MAKLRRLADCMEQGKPFRIQIAGEKVNVPSDAVFSIEHEREGNSEEVEFKDKNLLFGRYCMAVGWLFVKKNIPLHVV